ncbi:MAG: SDR family oxidoreductase [Firmicutes bacterium]|nr:SDR family oxidoreductase [Bacillota bacterium]
MSKREKIIFITGVGSGIGKETAILAVKRNWIVVGFELNQSALDSTNEEIKMIGGKMLSICGDQAQEMQCDSAVKQAIKTFGYIDALVLSAALVRQNQEFTEMKNEIWHENIEINLNGIFYLTQRVVRQMKKQANGSIIFISSVDAYTGNPDKPQYAMVKGAIVSLNKSIARAYGPNSIRSNCIAPGMTITPLTEERCNNPNIRSKYIDTTPLRRLGKPEDIGEAILFLASESSSWISGETIHVNGGAYMA